MEYRITIVSSRLIPRSHGERKCVLGMEHRLYYKSHDQNHTLKKLEQLWSHTTESSNTFMCPPPFLFYIANSRERERERKIILPLTDRLHTEQVEAKQRDFTQAGPLTSSPQSLHRLAKPASE